MQWHSCVAGELCKLARVTGPEFPPPPPLSLQSDAACQRLAGAARCGIKDSACPVSVDRVPGEIKRSRDLRGGRWSWTLTFAQKRSWVGRWSWAEQVGRLLLRVVQVVRQQRCNGHCLSDSVQHSSWKSNCAVHKSLGNGEGTPP